MAKKKTRVNAELMPLPISKTSPKDITPEQYAKAWETFVTSGSIPDIQARSGLTIRQFQYLLTNALPGYEDTHPSFSKRFADIAAEMRSRELECAKVISEGALRNIKNADKAAQMAEVMSNLIIEGRVRDLVKNRSLSEEDDAWKPAHKLVFSQAEYRTLNILSRYMDYRRVAGTFNDVYNDPSQQMNPLNQMPKGTKVDMQLKSDLALPAVLASLADVKEAHEQGEDDFHQRLFRDFDAISDEDLEAFLKEGTLPSSEVKRRT